MQGAALEKLKDFFIALLHSHTQACSFESLLNSLLAAGPKLPPIVMSILAMLPMCLFMYVQTYQSCPFYSLPFPCLGIKISMENSKGYIESHAPKANQLGSTIWPCVWKGRLSSEKVV